MSTDITIEAATARSRINFGDFVEHRLELVARSIAVVLGAQHDADAILESTLRSARSRWSAIGFDDEAEHYLFRTAFALALEITPQVSSHEIVTAACAVAHHGLGWPIDLVSDQLDLPSDEVVRRLQDGQSHLLVTDVGGDADLAQRIQQAIAAVSPQLPDASQIDRAHTSTARRQQLKLIVASVVALVIVVGIAGRFLPGSGRIDSAAPALPTPAAVRESAAATEPARATAETPEAAAAPHLVAGDGAGGFAGARPDSAGVEFTQSKNGTDWSRTGRATFSSYSTIDRFERSGDSYLAWLRAMEPSKGDVLATFATSGDLLRWNELDLTVESEEPRGLLYEPVVADAATSGTNVLVVVRVDVDVNYPALNLSEGYTCGRTLEATEVVVNMCNGRFFDVLDFAGLSALPNRHRLYLSAAGETFEEVSVPFGYDTTPRLANIDGVFALTDENGVLFATSSDGQVWQSVASDKPPFPVLGAASNPGGATVGLGRDATGELALFRYESGLASTVSLATVVAQESEAITDAVVARTGGLWVVYAFGVGEAGWLLTSPDGLRWRSLGVVGPASALVTEPTVIVGTSQVVLQWRSVAGGAGTQVIPIS